MDDFIRPLSDEFEEIYFIEGEKQARYPYSNSMVFGNYLIDTGISPKRLRKVLKAFRIDNVLLSHWHEDHVSGNYLVKKAEFYCHEKDRPIIEDITKMNYYYNTENTPVANDLNSLIEVLRIKDTHINNIINNNQILSISDQMELKVIHAPGHTAGHCAFYEKSSKIGFFGDIDLTRYPYYGNIDASLIDFENSLNLLDKMDLQIVVTGHKPPIYGRDQIKAEIRQYRMILEQRDRRIIERLREYNKAVNPQDLEGQNLIYQKYTVFKNFELISEVLMISKHFEKFERDKIIQREKGGFVLNV